MRNVLAEFPESYESRWFNGGDLMQLCCTARKHVHADKPARAYASLNPESGRY